MAALKPSHSRAIDKDRHDSEGVVYLMTLKEPPVILILITGNVMGVSLTPHPGD
jgi:hypothetical protein